MNKEQKMLMASAKLTIKLVLKSIVSRKNYRGLKIVHDDASMQLMGGLVGMFLRVSIFDLIVVDDNFYELDEKTQEFILAHEYGHSVDKELGVGTLQEKNELRIDACLNGEVIREEAFADDEGVKAVGFEAAIDALEELRLLLPYFGREEVECRITRIVSNLEGGK